MNVLIITLGSGDEIARYLPEESYTGRYPYVIENDLYIDSLEQSLSELDSPIECDIVDDPAYDYLIEASSFRREA